MTLKSNPLNEKQLAALKELTGELTADQIIWLNGYLEGRLAAFGSELGATAGLVQAVGVDAPAAQTKLTILYGTETGNSKSLADKLAEKAENKNISANVVSMYDFNYKKLKDEKNIAIIVSTHGEGDPPDMAEDFHKYLTGKRAPRLEELSYSVLALGDKSYRYFCKTGEEIDAACKSLGALRLVSSVKCDVDYENDAEVWMNNFLLNLKPAELVADQTEVKVEISEYSKKNPFLAPVLEKVKITGRDSDKEVYHFELSLEGSGLKYEPGDSLGVFTKNPDTLVDLILKKTGFDPEQKVDIKAGEVSILDALTYHLEITILSFDMIRKYAEKTGNAEIEKLINDDKILDKYLYGYDLLDLLEEFPFEWNANKLVEILRPLPPRLYSISSSQKSVEDEVHATISVVRYKTKDRERVGACSSHLADEIDLDSAIPVYIDKNPAFKLPPNGSKIIMVGAGTGIAPYRAFLQERESLGEKGNTWLFFGDRHFHSDFLYQLEWQKLLKNGYLEKLDVAFSRDQEKKVYIQHKLNENQKEIFDWIEKGAYFYLCGDLKSMAKDVNKTLLDIIKTQGGISEEKAAEYFKKLKREKRFQADVY